MRKAFIAAMTLLALAFLNPALAQDKLIFALVPPTINNPLFEPAHAGCKKAEDELDGVECLYLGPGTHTKLGQNQIVKDLITRKVNGIAVAPADAPAMANILKTANAAGIPVITWDSDVLKEDQDVRAAYVGSKNYDIGVNLAKIIMKLKPQGGTLCIQSGSETAVNHNERIQGIRDSVQSQNNWTEIETCPLYSNNDFSLAVQQMDDVLSKHPDLTAFVATGGFPQFVPDKYRQVIEKHIDRINNQQTVIVFADTLPVQMNILRDGLSHAQIGQQPFEMGYKAMFILKDLVDGKTVEDPVYTTLDSCEPENQDSCISG